MIQVSHQKYGRYVFFHSVSCLFTLLMTYFEAQTYFFFFFKMHWFILSTAALGLFCSAKAFSSCGEWELLFVVALGLLTAGASLVAEHGL